MPRASARARSGPDSVFPGLGGEGLVAGADAEMPRMAGTRPAPQPNPLAVMDHSAVPPVAGEAYDLRLPALDADGIAEVGVKLPYVAVPTGTYAGWNLRAEGFAAGELCSLTGSFVPFPAGAMAEDGREPLGDRYADEAAYRAALRQAAEGLVEGRLMLAGDIDLVLDAAPPLEPAAQ